jgi:hypothetical protein
MTFLPAAATSDMSYHVISVVFGLLHLLNSGSNIPFQLFTFPWAVAYNRGIPARWKHVQFLVQTARFNSALSHFTGAVYATWWCSFEPHCEY